ncbi:MAG: 6,7-dimethyl-8-ribityllumazine synthase [Verrucomicrobia bacterium]|nr:6,7-dimethyl-8-ribityllumazine synthase [Verrucomicrobiota bacterium]
MLKVLPNRPRVIGGKRTFALVVSQYNALYVQGLVDHTATEILTLMPAANLVLHQVPGAFEIPIVAQEIATRKEGRTAEVIIALGVIIAGDTDHAEHIGRTVTDALMRISLRTRVPIIHQVLSVKDEAQARVRCLEDKFNRGTEAARAAITVSQLLAELKAAAAV